MHVSSRSSVPKKCTHPHLEHLYTIVAVVSMSVRSVGGEEIQGIA